MASQLAVFAVDAGGTHILRQLRICARLNIRQSGLFREQGSVAAKGTGGRENEALTAELHHLSGNDSSEIKTSQHAVRSRVGD